MAKAGTKKRGVKKTDKKQSERFREAARELGLEHDDGARFEEVFGKVVPTAKPTLDKLIDDEPNAAVRDTLKKIRDQKP